MLKTEHPLYQEDLAQIASYVSFGAPEISVLITGASGLIGSLMVDALLHFNKINGEKKVHVYAMSRRLEKLQQCFSYALEDPYLTLTPQDITKPLHGEVKYDYIIHAASNADPRTYALYPVQTIQTNILGTTNVLEYARSHPGTRVLFTSTMEVYGTMPEGTVSKEDQFGLVDFNSVRSGYPESKRISELLCRSYAAEYEVDSVVTRLGYIYGPSMTGEDNKVIAQFIRKAMAKEDIVLKSKGDQRRSYCYAADTVSGIMCALFRGAQGEAYNVSNKNSVISIAEMAQVAADQAGTTVTFDLPDELERKGFSKSQDAVLDESKLRALGWEPKYTMAEGIARTVAILSAVE